MARLDIQIFADASNVTKGMRQATNAVLGFETALNKSTGKSENALNGLNAKVGQTRSQFKLLDKMPFSFGDRAAQQARAVDNSFQNINGFNKFKTGVGASNAVAQEFSRIVQDLPFGMIGIGNNIQQLTANFAHMRAQMAATSGTAVSFGAALKASMSAILSPANLLVLGVAAVTSAYTWWVMSNRGAKKSAEDTAQSFEEYARSLGEVRGALLMGTKDAQEEITGLETLYRVSQDAAQSTDNRKAAIKALQEQFPSYFGNLTTEQILNGDGAESYARLSVAMTAMAQARAIQNELAANSIELLRKEAEMQELVTKRTNAANDVRKAFEATRSTTGFAPTSVIKNMGSDSYVSGRELSINKEMHELAISISEVSADSENLKKQLDSIFKDGAVSVEEFVNGFRGNSDKVKEELKSIKKEAEKIALSPLEQSIKNALGDLSKLKSQLNKIYNADAFDPFDLSHLNRGKVTTEVDYSNEKDRPLINQISEFIKNQNKPTDKKESNDMGRALSRAIDKGVKDIYGVLLRVNQMEDAGIENVLHAIVTEIQGTVGDMMASVLSDSLKGVFKDAIGGFDSAAGKFSAAAGLIGGALSGIFKKTSVGGQAVSGGLQGAATGAMAGAALGSSAFPVVGTIIGGVVGAIGGIFGAKKAKKEEAKQRAIQEAQLREQEKQTKLMERQNALTYASQVIGRMVEGIGIVTNIDIGAEGQLVAKVEGEDIYFMLDRVQKKKERGL